MMVSAGEVSGKYLHYEGEALMKGISALIIEALERSHLFCYVRTQ